MVIFYGVTTTKILSSFVPVPNKNHVLIFKTAQEALTLGFRPCKRCQPTGQVVPNEEWVAQIKQFIDRFSGTIKFRLFAPATVVPFARTQTTKPH